MNKLSRLAAAATVAGVSLLASASPAAAHVSIQEGVQEAGAFTVLTFGIPHGCDGSPTTKVEIEIPEAVLNVTPTRNPLYDVEVTIEELAEPVTGPHGEEITTRDAVVVYTSTDPLPEGFRDALQLSLQIPEDAAGSTLYFPTVQTCAEGSTGWIEIPEAGQDPHDLEAPAPSVAVVEASDGGHGGGDPSDTEDDPAAGDGNEVALDPEAASSDDDGTDPVAVIALIVGALGLFVAAGGFLAARRTS